MPRARLDSLFPLATLLLAARRRRQRRLCTAAVLYIMLAHETNEENRCDRGAHPSCIYIYIYAALPVHTDDAGISSIQLLQLYLLAELNFNLTTYKCEASRFILIVRCVNLDNCADFALFIVARNSCIISKLGVLKEIKIRWWSCVNIRKLKANASNLNLPPFHNVYTNNNKPLSYCTFVIRLFSVIQVHTLSRRRRRRRASSTTCHSRAVPVSDIYICIKHFREKNLRENVYIRGLAHYNVHIQ